jgi:hypothetical protein
LCLVNPDSPNSLLATTHTNKFYGIHHGRRHQINDHQLRSGTPAGLIIIISELSNIGQTPSSMPDYLDQMILETRDLPSSGGSNFSLWKNRGYRRECMNTSTLLALVFVFLSLISLLRANPTWETSELQLGDNPSRISELGLRTRMRR